MLNDDMVVHHGVLPVNGGTPVQPNYQVWNGVMDYSDYVSAPVAYATMSGAHGLQQVLITGQYLNDYSGWEKIFVPYSEYAILNGDYSAGVGGGGSTGGTGCVSGQKIDWTFVEAREGSSTHASVPLDRNGHPSALSGATIASGFDIAQHSVNDLRNLGLTNNLIQKFTPYISYRGQAAADYLAAHPLDITTGDVGMINNISHAEDLTRVTAAYDAAVGAGAFNRLAAEAQTAIADLAFQYHNLQTRTPNFWTDVTYQDWTAAVSELRHFDDSYGTRRNLEADLLQSGIDSHKLKPGQLCSG
jgi:hypothetical protein